MVTEKVAIIIPALNEEAAIHKLLAELHQDFAQWVIVVDNGSTDARPVEVISSETLLLART
jgi:glycosyltransferase involved in cell wall biosynthesis